MNKNLIIFLSTLVGGLLLGMALYQLFKRFLHKTFDIENSYINKKLTLPFYLIIGIICGQIAYPHLSFPTTINFYIGKSLYIALVFSIIWYIWNLVTLLGKIVEKKFDTDKVDNLSQRKVITQVAYLRRLSRVILIIIATSMILLSFNEVKKIGIGLLTSAGVAGLIIGLAAQKSISNLLAGFQIAFTQPIRIDDVVIIENEYGTIEEINLTYVVVRVWDERRIILPLSQFIEKPFQNWTRTSADLLGTVYFICDYTIKIEALRQELDKILNESELWDKRVQNIVVTDSTEKGLQVRALMSAKDSGTLWDLRCLVREKLITFIQENQPESLPKVRIKQ